MEAGRDDALVAAARAGDEPAFAALVARHQRELLVHCYRLLGSFDEAEDLVQETFLRAWRHRADFAGRSTFRAWLYRIATNACLDALDGRARRLLPHQQSVPTEPGGTRPPQGDSAWLQPFPDRLMVPVADRGEGDPEAMIVARETIELAFLAAIQHLPPRQRAALLLRDVVGWPIREIATALERSAAAVNSALQRARATLRAQLPERHLAQGAPREVSAQELALLRRYMDAVERADLAALAAILTEDVRTTMPPYPDWFAGRGAVIAALAASWRPDAPGYVGQFRMLPTGANRQPAAAAYVRGRGDRAFRPFAIAVLRVAQGRIAEITAFHDTGLFPAFALPATLPDEHR